MEHAGGAAGAGFRRREYQQHDGAAASLLLEPAVPALTGRGAPLLGVLVRPSPGLH